MNKSLIVRNFYDKGTGTFSYLVADTDNKECVVIDPVLGFDVISSHTTLQPSEKLIAQISDNNWQLLWILETHAHADHLTSARQLQQQFGGKIAIGRGITSIQENFKSIYQFDNDYDTEGRAFDRLLEEGDIIEFGKFYIEVIATPGHTSDSLSYRLDNYLFIGDTLFHPDIGSARCDFPGGDATLLFNSIEKILSYSDDTLLCLCHDYPDESRGHKTFITIAEMKHNKHLIEAAGSVTKFKQIREHRDRDLSLPKLIVPSIQVNTQAGIDLSKKDVGLKWPINQF